MPRRHWSNEECIVALEGRPSIRLVGRATMPPRVCFKMRKRAPYWGATSKVLFADFDRLWSK